LFGGYAAANFLKWIWWRFNGYGYFWGMVAGLAASLAIPKVLPDISVIFAFPVILLISTIGCLAGTFLTKPDEEEVLKRFYSTVRPWGFWKYIDRLVKRENPEFQENKGFSRDVFNTVTGIIWQMTLVVMPIYLVIREIKNFAIALAIFVATTIILKRSWYNRLPAD